MANFTHYGTDKGTHVLIRPVVFADVVKVLIDLADRPDDVATDTDAGFAVRVPHIVYERFLDYVVLAEEDTVQASTPDAGNVDDAAVVPAPRKRGRPRKNPLPGEEG